MSIHTNEPQTGQDSSEGHRNPKAEAKAAKAYAKAVRPWYKKKRVLIPAGLVALAMVGAATSSQSPESGSTTTTAVADTKAAKSDKKAGKSEENVAKVGQTVTNAGTTYRVTTAKTTKRIGDPDLLGARADGVFVVVSLELTNTKDETKTFMDSNAKLKTSDGKEYETSDKAVMAFGDDSLMLKDIQPDLTTRGKLAFEIPPSKVSNSTLVIEDLWGSGDVKVALGL
ncbi:DUF4352 domain-containing protein [Solirubrobacter ginsenosidimutans]|uniref:DUF4352 domain-containing protein n=1 Tax=Solirubrobacter ginsenosidimutans TaxID=490573 RepID=A0A9X3RZX3_9ACTN|nr:DUF4352 domain-containing protein [Solirubrobacter ginsenosidimutans]MDA0158716.1 DUF4352 domain-containing protein [Solirubrobacter ginsenosidimutans]